jgi:hypothetical protein
MRLAVSINAAFCVWFWGLAISVPAPAHGAAKGRRGLIRYWLANRHRPDPGLPAQAPDQVQVKIQPLAEKDQPWYGACFERTFVILWGTISMIRNSGVCSRIVIGRTSHGLPQTYRLQRPSRGLQLPGALRRIFA